jgi:hypothetical protein
MTSPGPILSPAQGQSRELTKPGEETRSRWNWNRSMSGDGAERATWTHHFRTAWPTRGSTVGRRGAAAAYRVRVRRTIESLLMVAA